eukprot:CAMPEP_0195318070 /NCGR_PEP_ID=MMETSP0708-20121125/4641_1 /TAXON_ID=33640 /ORGANISM="Asterionellopsis glacialis, Strain CCMP134" /LENGTH=95 /DNA_ID=CAMNT_0040383923 /DNA_START=281 /DNA_END=564 /DNA_ORIENTATION=+
MPKTVTTNANHQRQSLSKEEELSLFGAIRLAFPKRVSSEDSEGNTNRSTPALENEEAVDVENNEDDDDNKGEGGESKNGSCNSCCLLPKTGMTLP